MKTKLQKLKILCLMLLVSSIGWGQIFESFETGLPSSYTTETTYNLSSGTWTGSSEQVISSSEGVNSGSFSLQLRSQTGSQITTPELMDGVSDLSFFLSASTSSGGLQVLVSEDGENFAQIDGSPLSFGTTMTQVSFDINNPDVTHIRFRRTGATVRIDDVQINPIVISSAELTAFNEPYVEDFITFNSEAELPVGWSLDDDTYNYGGDFGVGTVGGLRGNAVLGFQLTGSGGNSNFNATVELENNTGETINQLLVSYLGKVERVDQPGTPKWTVEVDGVEVEELEYETAIGVDQTKESLLTGLNIANGEIVTIKWSTTSSGTSGIRRQIGITDVNVKAVKIEIPFVDNFSDNPLLNGWTDQNLIGDQNWQWNSSESRIEMNAFESGCQTNENWLISPIISLSSNNLLRLDVDLDETFAPGGELVVLYSTVYTSGDPNASTWESVEVIESGDAGEKEYYILVDESDEFIRLAFLYDYSSGDCSRWEVNSVSLEAKENLFVFDQEWMPSIPLNNATDQDNILVVNGVAEIDGTLEANNLEVATGATLSVTSSGVLNLAGDINNNGNLVFQSDADSAGQLGEFSGNITGSVTVERFIPSRRAFRFLSSPVGGVDIADAWQQQIHITGTGGSTNGFDESATNNPSMFVYNHSVVDQVNTNAWEAVTTTEEDIEVGKPYRVLVRGDRETVDLSSNDSPSSDVTLSATGNLHTGDFDVDDVGISDFEDNFTFVGNPYQAVVDLNEVSFGDDVNTSFVYYWDASLGERGAFATIELPLGSSSSSTNANQFLRPGQAFFVRNNDSGSDFSIQFNEDSKAVSGDQTQVFSNETNGLSLINIRLYTQEAFANNLKEQDALGLRFSAEGNNAVDHQDAVKMINLDENLASLNNEQLLSIENRNLPENEEEIQLITQGYTSDNYIFWLDLQNLPEGTTAFLKDAYTDELTELEDGINEIPFDVDSSIEESASLYRFTIAFDVETFSNQDFESLGVEIYPNPVSENLFINLGELQANKTQISIFDVAGRKVIQQQVTSDESLIQVDVGQLQSGLYFVEVQEEGKKFTKKLIKK